MVGHDNKPLLTFRVYITIVAHGGFGGLRKSVRPFDDAVTLVERKFCGWLSEHGPAETNEALHQQEEKVAADRARLFKGKAQCLSSDEFYQAVVAIEDERKRKEAGKDAKKADRERKKELKAKLEQEWAEMKQKHAAQVETWTRHCSDLLATGTRKKDHPPKPKLGKKPQLPAEEDDEDEMEDEINDDEEV
ncbi:hypothetical protein C8R44DRAFT_734109 [Mycena epipterygia]|nr:hypothetical protein C8R44DRAFT_734109 [Mycena epipterygia]